VKVIAYTQARQNLASTMDMVCEDCTPVTITRSGKQQAVVMLSLEEHDQLDETAHLTRSPANAKRLSEAIGELAKGKGKVRKLNLG
jgi:antitoxin YefM